MTDTTRIAETFFDTEGVSVEVAVDDDATIVTVLPLARRRYWSRPNAAHIRRLIHQAHAMHHANGGGLYSKRGTINPSHWWDYRLGWRVSVNRVRLGITE